MGSADLGVSHSWERENAPRTLLWRPTPSPVAWGSPPSWDHTAHFSFQAFLAPRPIPSLAGWFATSTVNVQGALWEEARPWAQQLVVQCGRPLRQASAGTHCLSASSPGSAQAPAQQLLKETNSSLYPLPRCCDKPALPFKPRTVTPHPDLLGTYFHSAGSGQRGEGSTPGMHALLQASKVSLSLQILELSPPWESQVVREAGGRTTSLLHVTGGRPGPGVHI